MFQTLTFPFLFLKQRIKKCGGFVAWNSIGQPHVNGRLAMTRSIGDLDLKKNGVIAEPETKRIKVSGPLMLSFPAIFSKGNLSTKAEDGMAILLPTGICIFHWILF